MPTIQQRNKLFIIIQNVSVILKKYPVDICLIRIAVKRRIIIIRCLFGAGFRQAVRHDKNILDITPFQPERKEIFTVVDAVGNIFIDVYDVLRQTCIFL